MLDFGACPELLEDSATSGLLHTLLSCTLHLRVLVGTPIGLPLPFASRLPVKVVYIPLAPLAPLDAARLLARRVGRPLQDFCARGAPASLEALAADLAVQRLRGHPTAIIAAAAAISARPPQLSIREALVALAPQFPECAPGAQ